MLQGASPSGEVNIVSQDFMTYEGVQGQQAQQHMKGFLWKNYKSKFIQKWVRRHPSLATPCPWCQSIETSKTNQMGSNLH